MGTWLQCAEMTRWPWRSQGPGAQGAWWREALENSPRAPRVPCPTATPATCQPLLTVRSLAVSLEEPWLWIDCSSPALQTRGEEPRGLGGGQGQLSWRQLLQPAAAAVSALGVPVPLPPLPHHNARFLRGCLWAISIIGTDMSKLTGGGCTSAPESLNPPVAWPENVLPGLPPLFSWVPPAQARLVTKAMLRSNAEKKQRPKEGWEEAPGSCTPTPPGIRTP